MKHTLPLLTPLAVLHAEDKPVPANTTNHNPGIDRIWLGHRSHDSLSGKGNQYPAPKSAFLKGADSYILLTLTKNPAKMVVEIKGLDGTVLDRKVYQ